MEYLKNWPQVCLAFLCLFFVTWYFKHKSQAIYYWPILGSFPSLLWNSNRFHDWITDIFFSLDGRGSFIVAGPIFSKLRYLITCHPQNIEHILKTNFSNFPKGPDFNEIFDILGNGIFNVDHERWQSQRKMAHASFSSLEFRSLLVDSCQKVLLDSLVPFLTHSARQGHTFDLQDVCKRFVFDTNMCTIFGRDERSLSINLPDHAFAQAVDDAQECILFRHSMPMFLWKSLRWLNVGEERKLSNAWRNADVILAKYISENRESFLKGVESNDLLSTYFKSLDDSLKMDKKFLRDTMFSMLIAGRDTIASGITWFLWLVSKAPHVEAKILEDLKLIASKTPNDNTKWPRFFDAGDLKGLVYLQAAFCESIRLYPPVPLNSKGVVKEDVLPDGSVVKPGMQIILSFYSEGKMPWIWGEDSLEFKPERWIDDKGKLSQKTMSNFFAFNLGPRTCLGKDITFTTMNCVVAAILFNFHVEVIEGQQISPKAAINLHMKNGLMVKMRERALLY